MQSTAPLFAVLVFALVAFPVEARTQLRTLEAQGGSARELGIDSLRLALDGNTVEVEAWTSEGVMLADCEMVWAKPRVSTICTLEDGRRYRWTVDKSTHTLTFEDLATGEGGTAFFGFDERTLEERFQRVPHDALPAPPEIRIEGDKSPEDFERDWGEKGRLIGVITGEVVEALGLDG